MYGKILLPSAPVEWRARLAARRALICRRADLRPALAGRINALIATMKKGITMQSDPDDSLRERLQRWALYLALLIMPGGFLIMPAVIWRMGQRKSAALAGED